MIGPAAKGSPSFGQFAKVTDGKVEASWLNALQGWWNRHGYYPDQAAQQGHDGKVRIEVVVDRSGKVLNVELIGKSGSQWLDLAAQGVFRGASLPPFPSSASSDKVTLELTINYILVR